MAAAKFIVTGNKKIDRDLKALGLRGASSIVRKAMRTSMKTMVRAVKDEEPVGETGNLHRRVKLRATDRSRNKLGVAVAIDNRDFPEKYYASFVELGTEHIEADHAMKRAFDQNKSHVRAEAMQLIRDALLRVWGS